MRELKFRAWNIKSGEYEDLIDVIGISPDGEWIYFKEPDEPGAFYTDTIRKNYIIEQYTGLNDKNGKEIYDGDIVKIRATSKAYQVVYRKWDCSFVCENDEDEEIAGIFNDFTHQYEVIGNIHENKVLLKEMKNENA